MSLIGPIGKPIRPPIVSPVGVVALPWETNSKGSPLLPPSPPVISLGTTFTIGGTITWPAVTGATSYQEYRDGVLAGTVTSPITIAAADTGPIVTVKAVGPGGTSAASNALQAEVASGVQLVATQRLLTGNITGTGLVCLFERYRPDVAFDNNLYALGGTSGLGGGGAGGASFIVNNAGLGSIGNQVGFANVASDGKIHITLPGEVSRLVNDVMVRDVGGNKDRTYRDKREFGIAVSAGAGTGYENTKICINGSPFAPGSFGTSQTFVEMQIGTTALSAAQIAALVDAPVGTQMPGCVHQWMASDLSGGVIADRVSPGAANNMTLTGAGSLVTGIPVFRYGRGSIELYGDSITAGKLVDTTLGNGYRKQLQALLVAAGYSCTLVGQYVPGASCTTDFDGRCTGLSSQALGLLVGAVASRLSTLATDVTLNGGPDCASGCFYGANDVFQRITNGETPTQCRDHFLADLDTFCSTVRAVRTGRIVIGTVLRQGTSASTANMRTAIDAINTALPATVATLLGTYGDVVLADTCAAITPNQAAADDTAVLYDGIHPTPAAGLLFAVPIANAIAA